MKQFLTVLKFELNNYFKNKSFVLTTIVLMVLAAGIIALPGLLMGRDDSSSVSGGAESGAAAEETDGTVALFDKNGNISDPAAFGEAMGMNIEWVICTDSAQVEDAVNEGNAEAGFIVEDLLHYTYVVENRSMSDTLQSAFSQAAAMSWRAQTLTEEGLDPAEIESLYQVQPQYETQILGKDSAGSYAYTYMLIMILYFLLIFYGQMIATSVTSEKSNRAIEILVTSVDSNSLIFGKVLAGAIAGLIQCVLILGSAVGTYQIFRESWGGLLDNVFDIPVPVWAAFGVFGMMGYLLYAFCFGMLGALVSKTEDISKASMPVLMIYIISFFIAIMGLNDSNSLLVRAASFIPFTSSNGMLIRISMGSVEMWEIIVSGALLAVFCVGAGILAAKIFRFGTLMYGNPIKFTTALKKIREK
ncbi:MAG TPA: ABC transporter permease [Candidatus Mediterraneibacter stercoravium]|uniref:ABC transporter permease n=1 Tax=Candidatus Mediterraneibacter stercoravium TaxID=2838685 RepID=A0A9D2G856_9FIRM|nr:ABC transporter permease [Candidatus Mediterraneibacter stercoravium]